MEANHLIKVFNALLANEVKKHEAELSSEDSENLIDPLKDEENIVILDLIETFNSKRKEEQKASKKKEEDNLKRKNTLLNELESLIQTKENIGSLIAGIRTIREKWSEIGGIPREKYNETQAAFSKSVCLHKNAGI